MKHPFNNCYYNTELLYRYRPGRRKGAATSASEMVGHASARPRGGEAAPRPRRAERRLICVRQHFDPQDFPRVLRSLKKGAVVRQVESAVRSEGHVAGRKGQPGQDLFDLTFILGEHQLSGPDRGRSPRRRELLHVQSMVGADRKPGNRGEAEIGIDDLPTLGDLKDLSRTRNIAGRGHRGR